MRKKSKTPPFASNSFSSSTDQDLSPLGESSSIKNIERKKSIRIVCANDPFENAKYVDNRISNTKYTIITFLPKNLKEQFGRFMNLYFLMIACLQLWSYITPVNPWSTWGPLLFIFAISALKEAIDDYHRYQSDKKANERLYYVVRDGHKKQVEAQHILVGDILYLEANEEIPCDLVLISTSDPDGICYIQTANIDGETDYKARQALSQTANLRADEDLRQFKGIVECALPNAEIYRFDSRLKYQPYDDDYISLSEKQLLLQATHIKNTDWVYGLAVYTGNETKVGQNKEHPPIKWTKQDRFVNRVTIFIFCFQLSLVVIFGIIGNVWKYTIGEETWYLQYDYQPWYEVVVIPLRFLLLNSMMIPISLKVTLDITKFCYAKFIDWDVNLYDEESDTPANATNTSISEDMGQIEYIFTDKTGTLTENRMLFKQCSINNIIYGDDQREPIQDSELRRAISEGSPSTHDFFKVLSLCHTVIAARDKQDNLFYKSASPDEEALVKAAAQLNFVFKHSDSKRITISIMDTPVVYQKLNVLEFTSERKRMSVVLREENTGKIKLYSKGADDVILARLASDPASTQQAQNHLEQFAHKGLRTLCVAQRDITEEEYNNWLPYFHKAQTAVENRNELIAEAAEAIECNLTLVGVSAIEDQLQDQVPETIQALRDAGIKIFMLTGDKFSTAVQIATSCNLISSVDTPDQLLVIQGNTDEEVKVSLQRCQFQARQHQSSTRNFTVIVEGKHLAIAIKSSDQLLELCLAASAVICCRVTPQQKAQVVRLVKDAGHMTLAIGDGGNDVVMIQEAHIGIGIAGREGLQAARAADYSVGKFRFLRRLLLIHGRYSYIRTAFVSQYSFYKSLFICFIQIMYCFLNGFSGTSFFNTFSLTTYNVLFTSIPPLFYVLDKDLPERQLWNNPLEYQETQKSRPINIRTMLYWVVRAFYQALVVFVFTVVAYGIHSGSDIPYDSISMIVYTTVITTNCLTVALESRSLTWVNHAAIWGTLLAYFIIMIIVNLVPTSSMYWVMFHLFDDSRFWFSVILGTVAALAPVYAIKYYTRISAPLVKRNSMLPTPAIPLSQAHDQTPLLTELV